MLKRIFNWWTITILTALVVAAILVFALPIFLHFLRPWWVRLLMGLFVFLVWGVFAVIRVFSRRRASDAIAAELAKSDPADAESQTLALRMAGALKGLRQASGNRRDYLYSRPWYVIIGPPGAGKTTALLNSGLRFPFSDSALKGVGGTRNLDFWFADEAAMVDTAGRYTTQDSDASTDARAWNNFLGLLRRNRPLQPINGVLVAIGLDEVLKADRASLDAHAMAVRRRLTELRQTLEVNAPIYVLFTKADLLAGFSEFYDDLDVEGRRAVVGATMPYGQRLTAESLASQFDAFAQSIADRGAKRLQEVEDARRRGLILGFPSQVTQLRSRVMRFLDGAFLADDGSKDALRGFYLTSGVQAGAPLDRLLSGVAEVYDQPQQPAGGQGRAYFLNRLLHEVVIPEAGLVESDPKARARRAAMMMGGLIGVAAVVLLTLVLWSVSFVGNRNLQTKLLASAQNAQNEVRQTGVDMVEVRESDPDLEQALSVMRALRELPGGYADQKKGGHPFFLGFGLYQSGHAEQAKQAYLEGLRRILLPRMLLRLEHFQQDHRNQAMPLYDALKAYLMLGGQGPMDSAAVKAWVEGDWQSTAFPGADREDTRKQLGEHLDALLGDKELGAAWPGHKAPLDGAVIQDSRAAISNMSLSDRAYAIMRSKSMGKGAPWLIGTVLSSGDSVAFANPAAVMQLQVPYFFTKEGYQRSYIAGLQTAQEDLKKDLWVLGSDADTSTIKTQLQAIKPGIASAYAHDYIAAWEGIVKALQPADYFHDPAAFGAFTRTPSPLTLVLLELRKNTTFSAGAQGAANAAVQSKLGVLGGADGVDAGQQIEQYFKPVSDYVGDGKTPGPLDTFIAAVKTAGSANAAAAAAGGGLGGDAVQGQLATATGGLAVASAGAPPLMQTFVASAAKGGQTAAASSAKNAVSAAYQTDLAKDCQTVSQDHYPFFGAALNEASVTDMLRVFGMNGQFDNFSHNQIKQLLDTAGPVWRWNATDPVGSTLDPLSAEQFQKAADLRDLISTGLPLKVEGAGFGGAVTAVEFSINGVSNRFDVSSPGARQVTWTISSGQPEAHVFLYSGDSVIKRFDEQGTWAIFKLMDKARKENAGPTAIKATFGDGAAFATLRITLPSDKNPFSRGGLWSFRCPASL